ncbi:hypothetical protein [Pedobacter immunditicola]|uniref:hypothetical protein n=1 Tax=Pedobacter immunditicola TaxID=3133440 RepID=UPI0030AD41B0
MAAPINAYRTKSIYTRNKENTADIQTLTAIPQADKATMQSRFHLDGLFNANLGGEGDGVVGYCRIGTPNFNMHNNARHSNLRLYDGGDCVLFNDAGLNTYGNLEQVQAISIGGMSVVFGSFGSSYYSTTSNFGIRYKPEGGSAWTTLDGGTLPSQQSSVLSDQLVPFIIDASPNTINIIAFITNEEGTRELPAQNFLLNNYYFDMRFSSVNLTGALDSTTTTQIYTNAEGQFSGSGGLDIGAYVTPTRHVSGVQPAGTVPNGYYLDTNSNIWIRVAIINGKSKITQKGSLPDNSEGVFENQVNFFMRGPAATKVGTLLAGRKLIYSSNGKLDANSNLSLAKGSYTQVPTGWYMLSDTNPRWVEIETVGGTSKITQPSVVAPPTPPVQVDYFTDPASDITYVYHRSPNEGDTPFWGNVCINLTQYMNDGNTGLQITLKRNVNDNKFYGFSSGSTTSDWGLAHGLYFNGTKTNGAYNGDQWVAGVLTSSGDCNTGFGLV